jgi:hypothetical protein
MSFELVGAGPGLEIAFRNANAGKIRYKVSIHTT